MKVAVIGSRDICIKNLGDFLPDNVDEIVSGGANGVDKCARDFAVKNGIKFTEFLPEYSKYGRSAPLKRNDKIIDYADIVYAFWDGGSHGTKYVIDKCNKTGREIRIFYI